MTVFVQLPTAFLGALGFAVLFGVLRRCLWVAAVGGMLTWGVYLAVDAWLHVEFLSCLAAAAFAVTISELLARKLKLPATMFITPAIIPLVPGGTLYYAMSFAVHGDLEQARSYGLRTLLAALAIAGGISLVTVLRELRARR